MEGVHALFPGELIAVGVIREDFPAVFRDSLPCFGVDEDECWDSTHSILLGKLVLGETEIWTHYNININ